MQTQFKQHIQNKFPFLKGKKILLALSGGLDSTVLAHLCKNNNLDIAYAHCNFRLRGNESDSDQLFVEKLAKEMETQIFIQYFDAEKFASENNVSIQMAARELRYEWFEELADKHGFDYIFTAHHANDSLETLLINIVRGTGLEGLTGIPEQNGKIIRPLLPFSRNEIYAFAEKEKITWREDSSNASEKYLRNKIRHQIIPILENENSHLLESFLKTQKYLQDTSDLLSDYSVLLFDEIVEKKGKNLHFNISKIRAKSNPQAVLYQLLKPYDFTAWEDIHTLLSSQSGKMVFSPKHRLLKNREELILTEIPSEENSEKVVKIPENAGSIDFPLGKLIFEKTNSFEKTGQNQIYVDKNAIKFPLTIRKWKESDYFYPLGMNGKKKVSKFLKDEKLSLFEKEKVWLLISEGKIVWIIGYRADGRFKVNPGISNIASIRFV